MPLVTERESWCRTMTIPDDCGSVCVVDLVQQGISFSFGQDKIGEFPAWLEASSEECRVHLDKKETRIQLTLSPSEITGIHSWSILNGDE